tara:strand:+ start:525 stop:737 length:213 start_codon:yes stop_codon:yes gene_type:complete
MDKKRLISFSDSQDQAISEAAHKSGLSFTAYVRMAALMQVTKQGVEVSPPKEDLSAISVGHGLVLDIEPK